MYLALTGARIYGEDTVRYGTSTHFIRHYDFDNIQKDLIKKYKDKDLKTDSK